MDFFNATDMVELESIIYELVTLNQMTIPQDLCDNYGHLMKQGFCNKKLGFYGEETPMALINHVLEHSNKNHQGVDAVLLNGDFVKHGVALPQIIRDEMNKTWSLIKYIIK